MSEMHQAENEAQENGHDAVAASSTRKERQEVARGSVKNGVTTIEFVDGTKRIIDVKTLPVEIMHALAGRGFMTVAQNTYQKCDTVEDAIKVVDERIASLQRGEYTTRIGGAGRRAYDDLTMALAELLKKEPTYVDDVWLPAYYKKHCTETYRDIKGKKTLFLVGKKEVEEGLRTQKQVAPILAKMFADKARAARGGSNSGEDLTQLTL